MIMKERVMKRVVAACLVLLMSLGLIGCWEDFYIPPTKGIDVGGEPSSDWEKDYGTLLQKYVNQEGLVDYVGLNNERKVLDGVLLAMAKLDPKDWKEEQKLAFWINAYNVSMLFNILEKYDEIKDGLVTDQGDLFFKRRKFDLAMQQVSLDELENSILRRQPVIENISTEKLWPEIHVALCCAAQSCPPLLSRVWKADTVVADLDKRMREIANNESFVSLENGKVSITTLADWFHDDFKVDGKTVGDFFADRITGKPELVKALREAGDDKTKLSFKPYDWRLNEWKK